MGFARIFHIVFDSQYDFRRKFAVQMEIFRRIIEKRVETIRFSLVFGL